MGEERDGDVAYREVSARIEHYKAQGAAEERAAVVEGLRRWAKVHGPDGDYYLRVVADWVERGAHHDA